MFEEEQHKQDHYEPHSPPPPVSMGQEVHMYRLNNIELIELIEHQLRNERPSAKKGGKWIPKGKPWATEEGISKIMGILSACGLNKNINLGCLTHDEIYERCRLIWQKLAYMIAVNSYKYGVERSNRSMLIQITVQQIHSALSRSEKGREAKQLSTTTQHLEHTVREDKGRQPLPMNPARLLSRREL